MKHLTIKCRS